MRWEIDKGASIVTATAIILSAVFLMGCVTEEDGAGICGGTCNLTDDTQHPDYHPTANLCGAYVYAYPNFVETPREDEPCVTSLDCELHPPVNIPDGTYCCVNDGTCYRGIENGQ